MIISLKPVNNLVHTEGKEYTYISISVQLSVATPDSLCRVHSQLGSGRCRVYEQLILNKGNFDRVRKNVIYHKFESKTKDNIVFEKCLE